MTGYEERKQMVLAFMSDDLYVPMKIKELAIVLGVSKEDRPQLEQILAELTAEGKVMLSKRGKYSKGTPQLQEGTYLSTRQDFGFISVPDRDEDYFVSAKNRGGAFDGDTVKFEVMHSQVKGKRKAEARIVSISTRAITKIVGLFDQSENFGFVRPNSQKFDSDIFIPKEHFHDALDGQRVVCEITDYGDDKKKPEGRIVEVLGYPHDAGVDMLTVMRNYDLPTQFDEKVLNQALRVATPVTEDDIAYRKDLRDIDMVTIDGVDSKDFDDAVSVQKTEDGYVLGVHIADVTNYVQEGSALDREAKHRGTSVYLPGTVIPMLPEVLSNGICSLNAGENRLALSCLMTYDKKGELKGSEICESVICVNERMTYPDVDLILDGDEALCERYTPYLEMFRQMHELADILRERRKTRGSIDFDLPETQILMDDEGQVTDIRPYERGYSMKLIEDFMLAANETIAETYFWQQVPFVFRCHDTPDPEKILELEHIIGAFGYGIHTAQKEIHPKEFQKLLAKIQDTPEEAMISKLTLRSMKRAQYQMENIGHFGLSARYYCHFTSPIRRYPDLQIHRIIKESLRGKLTDDRSSHYDEILPAVIQNSNYTERRADDAERDGDKIKIAQYMSRFIGESFEGTVSSVTGWGIYVTLPNTAEGMIRLEDLLDDIYYYDDEKKEVYGSHNGHVITLGTKMKVVVKDADVDRGTVDFIPDDGMEHSVVEG